MVMGVLEKMLKRDWKNESIIDALKIPVKYGFFGANNITGFPAETRELAMDTVELNQHIKSPKPLLFCSFSWYAVTAKM